MQTTCGEINAKMRRDVKSQCIFNVRLFKTLDFKMTVAVLIIASFNIKKKMLTLKPAGAFNCN